MQQQLLYAPVQDFGDVDFVLGRAGDFMDPSELFRLASGLSKNTQNLPVER